MPKTIKKRPVKKKPAQEDEVKSAAMQALEKVRERQKHVILGVSVFAGIIILYVVFSLYSSSMSSKAYSFEQEAYQYYYSSSADKSLTEKDRWNRALDLYKKSFDTKANPSALFYIANCYYNLGDYENAINEYNLFADKYSSDKGILPLAYQKLASAYFKTNQPDKALDALNKLGGVDGGLFRDTALILEARHFEGAGQKERALEKYREIISDFPVSAWTAEANSKVSVEEAKITDVSPEQPADEPDKSGEPAAPEPGDTKDSEEQTK